MAARRWLALHPGPQPRGEVAGRLWPEVLEESARASLRTALAELRRDLGDGYLAANREGRPRPSALAEPPREREL